MWNGVKQCDMSTVEVDVAWTEADYLGRWGNNTDSPTSYLQRGTVTQLFVSKCSMTRITQKK